MIQTYQNHNTLYYNADPMDIKSHVIRMLTAYKNIQVDCVPVGDDIPQSLLDENPHGTTPTWVDREVVVYEARILLEYIEERYPAPSLLPPVPSARAQTRMLCHRIEKDWVTRLTQLTLRDKPETRRITQDLVDSLTGIAHTFDKYPYFKSETMTLADCMLLAVLWRLIALKIQLPKEAMPLVKYAQRLFQEPFFQESLTKPERALITQEKTTA